MHRATLRQFKLLKRRNAFPEIQKLLMCPHHFHFTDGIVSAAHAIGRHEFSQTDAPRFPIASTPPAPEMVVTAKTDNGTRVFILRTRGNEVIVTSVYSGFALCTGAYTPGSRNMRKGGDNKLYDGEIVDMAFCISLINEPRRVTCSPPKKMHWTQDLRSSIRKVTGRAALAYSSVSWQVGAGVRAKGNPNSTSGLKKPLHWCRAHFRKSLEHHENSVWVQPFTDAPAGWYTWIHDCWKGHPDHGIKLQRHEPRVKSESRQGQQYNIPGPDKLAAMSAQQRHALVEAGYAPSAILN